MNRTPEEVRLRFFCVDCGFDTFHQEYYSVRHHLWPLPKMGGMLCIGCLEERLGFTLTPEDFIDCPLNRETHNKSDRLLDRLGLLTHVTCGVRVST